MGKRKLEALAGTPSIATFFAAPQRITARPVERSVVERPPVERAVPQPTEVNVLIWEHVIPFLFPHSVYRLSLVCLEFAALVYAHCPMRRMTNAHPLHRLLMLNHDNMPADRHTNIWSAIACMRKSQNISAVPTRGQIQRQLQLFTVSPHRVIAPPGVKHSEWGKLTLQQLAIIDVPIVSGASIHVQAFAGTGKTTTARIMATKHAHAGLRVMYVAYNKTAQLDAEKVLHKTVKARTFHSLAYGWCKSKAAFTNRVVGGTLAKSDYKLRMAGEIPRAVKAAATDVLRSFCASEFDEIQPENLVSAWTKLDMHRQALDVHAQVTIPEDAIMTNALRAMLKRKQDAHVEIDILDAFLLDFLNIMQNTWDDIMESGYLTHDYYLKIYQLRCEPMDHQLIVVDEEQDLSPVMIDITRKISANACLLAIGDRYQQIYTWRGARGMNATQFTYNFELTQSFRFGGAIARMANGILNAFNPDFPSEIWGNRATTTEIKVVEDVTIVPDWCVVLARTNSQLVDIAVTFSEADVAFEITDSLLAAVRDFVDVYAMIHGHAWINRDFLTSYPNTAAMLRAAVNDPHLDSMIDLAKKKSPDYVRIVRSFKKRSVIHGHRLMTIHAAKGTEADNVLLLRTERLVQEHLLHYVAVTRARKCLYIFERGLSF